MSGIVLSFRGARSRAPSLLSGLVIASAFAFSACGDDDDDVGGSGGKGGAASGKGGAASGGSVGSEGGSEASGAGESGGANGMGELGGAGGLEALPYAGPTVGRAKTFAALAYSAVTNANLSDITGEIGVSAGPVSSITGFDEPSFVKYGDDSLAPNAERTLLAQQDVTALVANIDPRPCDADYTDVVGGLTGDITLHPGVTCMNSPSADVALNGHVYLDAGGDPNAFFIIRGALTLTVADAAKVVLTNGAQACSVFWRFKTSVTIGKTAQLYGTFVSGSAITMNTGATLVGRALAQTEGVQLDANTITAPSDCSHVQ